MDFHEVRFPESLSFGSVGGPERRTEIVTLSNGAEERSTPWAHSRRRYDAGLGMRSLDDLGALIAFFEARHGQLFGFRWKDWTDFKSCKPSGVVAAIDQRFGVGDGATTEFQLAKTYRSGAARYVRPIAKPVEGTVRIAIGGDEKAEGQDYVLDYATGLVTFASAPQVDAPLTAGYEYDVPVRFDTDRIEASVASFSAGEIPSVPVIEVRV
ncbi:phage distal tail protein, Rcc01695 family [Halovulum sp. GXIMD14794]